VDPDHLLDPDPVFFIRMQILDTDPTLYEKLKEKNFKFETLFLN